MTRDDIVNAFDHIRIWQRGERRAPHKPPLILLVLSKTAKDDAGSYSWTELEPELKKLLIQFGPSGSQLSAHYPFWHLHTDGIWKLEGPDALLARPPGATPNAGDLKSLGVRGGLNAEIREALRRDHALLGELAHRIVEAHFPESIQADVLAAVGLDEEEVLQEPAINASKARRRDPAFREHVLRVYGYRCAVCGHDLRLGQLSIGLEAAHIRWFQAKGPDVVPNGVSLCTMHHKVFDLGAFTILPGEFRIVFSEHLNGGNEATMRMLRHHGGQLILPVGREYFPASEYLAWHQKQVFKEPRRNVDA